MRVRRLPRNLIVDFRYQVREPLARILIELAMHIQCVVDQLPGLHLVKLALVLNLTLYLLGRIPIGLVGNRYRHFNQDIRGTGRLLNKALFR